jgi:hypothetical protein
MPFSSLLPARSKADGADLFAPVPDELRRMAERIRARAIRRCGELLQQIEDARGGDRKSAKIKSKGELTFDLAGKPQAAREAGLSLDQQRTATRPARIPEDDFDAAVENDDAATVTELAAAMTSWRTGGR